MRDRRKLTPVVWKVGDFVLTPLGKGVVAKVAPHTTNAYQVRFDDGFVITLEWDQLQSYRPGVVTPTDAGC